MIILERAGYRALEAANGGEAIHLARTRKPDIILMDIGMPVMDGLSASEAIKDDPETGSIPIIVVTGHTLRREREHMDRVSDDHLFKPCAPHEILVKVARFTGSGNAD